jgi:hypothetical protein
MMPGVDMFEANPDAYVNFWKSWYLDHAPKATAKPSSSITTCHPLGPAAHASYP